MDPKEGPSQDAPAHGGPGDVEAPRQELQPAASIETPKVVTIRQHGREYQMPEDVAQAWQEREQAFSRQGQELGELRRLRQQIEQTVQPPKATEPDINTLWFENPAAAAKRIKEETARELREEYQTERNREKFWDTFYRKHDDLREDDWVVEAQLARHGHELVDLPVPQAQDKLAELTRNEILRLSRKGRSVEEPTPSRADLLEPASGERPPRRAPKEDPGPKSMSEHIRARQRAKAEAARRGA
jgi:hypothetical protein